MGDRRKDTVTEWIHTSADNVKAAKSCLSQIEKVDRLINRLVHTADQLRRSITGCNYALNPDKVMAMTKQDRIGETTIKIIDLEQQIDAYIDTLVSKKSDALERIRKVPDFFEQEILVVRYIQVKRLEDFAEEVGKSSDWIFKVHRAALRSFAEYNRDIYS